jgi:hypothetical protein
MADRPELAVVHDGELDDVRTLLDGMGVAYACWRKSRANDAPPDPSRLLLIGAQLAVSLRCRRVPRKGTPIWIAVVDRDSGSLRSFLAQSGFTYVVRRPVHPVALHALVRRALFAGKEVRRSGRVVVGTDVTCRVGLRWLRGTLVDLSPTGCRLFVAEEPAPGAVFHVRLPGDLAGGSRFAVAGRVVRSGSAGPEGGDEDEHAVGLRFDPITPATKDSLAKLLGSLAAGPATRNLGKPGLPARAARARFGETVHSLGDGPGALVARDLSCGGIRVEAGPSLAVGRQLRLAIETGGRSEPVIVTARVARDDGPRGLALRFESIEGDGERRLAQLVSRLPPLVALGGPRGPQQLLAQLGARFLRFAK